MNLFEHEDRREYRLCLELVAVAQEMAASLELANPLTARELGRAALELLLAVIRDDASALGPARRCAALMDIGLARSRSWFCESDHPLPKGQCLPLPSPN